MKKQLLLLVYVLIFSSNAFAQYTLDWQQNANYDQKQSVMSVVDTQDNVVVTGYLQSNAMFTRKYDIQTKMPTTKRDGLFLFTCLPLRSLLAF